MLENHDGRWFAVQVRPNTEQAVLTSLRNKEYETYLPTYRCTRQWSDRIKKLELPLFAGYIFCRFNSAIKSPIMTTGGVLRILGIGNTPIPLEDEEINSLRTLGSLTGIRFYPWPRLEEGGQVCIQIGPLRGLVGVLRFIKNESTLILSVPLLQRSVAVEIPADWVTPAGSKHGDVQFGSAGGLVKKKAG
ncbi:MAG TPA: transcription termination/antitermination NusG family protein [Terriglobales bacterium]|nr:transcription termination/antitermination NusG family protein [Terriglobales bacterium]